MAAAQLAEAEEALVAAQTEADAAAEMHRRASEQLEP
jgi:hypothetical protein